MNDLIVQSSKWEATQTGLIIKEDLTYDEWFDLGKRLGELREGIQWLIGDWAIAEGCVINGVKSEAYSLLEESVSLSRGTIQVYKSVCENVKLLIRIKSLTFLHHQFVAPLKEEQQKYWLQKALENEWSASELKRQIRKRVLAQTPGLPKDKYEVIYADPPWEYGFAADRKPVDEHYPTMNLEALCGLGEKIKEISADDCVLYLWATSGRLDWAIPVMEAWGFDYKSSMIWDKVKYNMGYYCSIRHEFILIGGKGTSTPTADPKIVNSVDSVISVPKSGRHSEKPEEVREIIEKLYPNKKRIELFARKKSVDWDAWGKEI